MALKDEDTLMKRKKELDEAIANLGVQFDEVEPEFVDELANQFDFDQSAFDELTKEKNK